MELKIENQESLDGDCDGLLLGDVLGGNISIPVGKPDCDKLIY